MYMFDLYDYMKIHVIVSFYSGSVNLWHADATKISIYFNVVYGSFFGIDMHFPLPILKNTIIQYPTFLGDILGNYHVHVSKLMYTDIKI